MPNNAIELNGMVYAQSPAVVPGISQSSIPVTMAITNANILFFSTVKKKTYVSRKDIKING